tara:strand:+ start:274 stop:627 length:354 start_codon:yes stop_codon:yes gene_type:complete
MANASNGANLNDKVVQEKQSIKMVDSLDDVRLNPDVYLPIADYVDESGTRHITEGMEIEAVGCVHRETTLTPNGVAVSSGFIPDVRLVPRMKDDVQIGWMYISKTMRIRTDPLHNRR